MEKSSYEAQQRVSLLTETMRLFAEATTDYDRLVLVVARRVAELLKNTCAVQILSDDATALVPVAFHATDPAVLDQMRQLLATNPIRVEAHALNRGVLETGEPASSSHFVRRGGRSAS